MKSRMDKYYDTNDYSEDVVVDVVEKSTSSRTKKNQKLYKEVSNLDLEDFDLDNNVSVIDNNVQSIDVDKIRDMLDRKYREDVPKRTKIADFPDEEIGRVNLDETREYDINSILEKAKETQEVDYEEERLKKLRNTQYDILKSLDIFNKNKEEEEKEKVELEDKNTAKKKEEQRLLDLINTITMQEDLMNTAKLDPLDILSDLRGDDDNTRVMGALLQETTEIHSDEEIKEDTEEIEIKEEEKAEATKGIIVENKVEDDEETDYEIKIKDLTQEIKQIKKMNKEDTNMIDNSFITKSNKFDASDFDDFNDLKADMKFTKILVKILIIVIVLLGIFGIVFLANKFLGLGLF